MSANLPDSVRVPLTRKMSEAFDSGMPVLLLPPDFDIDRLMSLLIDVVLKGSEGLLLIVPVTDRVKAGVPA